MRVNTIEIANLCVRSEVVADPDAGFLWIVRVSERGAEHRVVFEKSGKCGRIPKGDALDIAAQRARQVSVALLRLPQVWTLSLPVDGATGGGPASSRALERG